MLNIQALITSKDVINDLLMRIFDIGKSFEIFTSKICGFVDRMQT